MSCCSFIHFIILRLNFDYISLSVLTYSLFFGDIARR
nr:MAG TPA: hypothetical protein [Caudoviricetes sp.]